jgi:hypothetical protein
LNAWPGEGQHPPHLHHRVAGAQLQRARHLGAGAQAPAFQDAALRRSFVAAVGLQLEEAVAHVLLRVGRHEGALALAAHHQVLGRQFVDGLAHRALADAEARGQLHLAGDGLARLPFAGLQALQDQLLDLLVQRTERGRGRRRVGRDDRVDGGVGGGHGRNRRPDAGNTRNHILYKT